MIIALSKLNMLIESASEDYHRKKDFKKEQYYSVWSFSYF
jgi:hypothetical protein